MASGGFLASVRDLFGGKRGTPAPAVSAPVASAAMAAPEQDFSDRSYAWGQRKLASAPQRIHYRDLPISTTGAFDDVATAKSALLSLEVGQFYQPAQLAESFGSDDRISGVLQTRVDALSSLPLEMGARDGRLKSTKIAERVQAEWSSWVSDAELKRLHRWAMLLGIGIGEIIWERTATAWTPHLKVWDPRYASWRWDTRSLWLSTQDGAVEVTPGDGHWIVYAPHGHVRGWMQGSLRPLAMLFLMRKWAFRDWARYSEVHGLPIKSLEVPADAKAEDKEDLESAIANLGGEGVIRLAQDENGKGFKFSLVEAKAQGEEGFRQLIEKCDECIAVEMLGQNLTTSVKGGGSYAAANVHDRIRLDRLESDAKGLGACLTEQLVLPWTVYNYGDAALAPTVSWSTKALGDRAAMAKMLNDLGMAIAKLKDAGLPVDLEELARQFRVPLTTTVDAAARGQVYEYHLKYGVLTINEARARLGLPPIEGGDVPPAPAAAEPETPNEAPEDEPESDEPADDGASEDAPDAKPKKKPEDDTEADDE